MYTLLSLWMLAAPPQPGGPRIVVDVHRVDLLVTVADRRGRLITGLNREQFEIVEAGRQQKILGFSTADQLPLRLAVVMDASNSVRERFRFIQEAAVAFLNAALRPPLDEAVVMSFATTVDQVAQLKSDPAELAAAIRDLHPGGGTSLYDAICNVCRGKLPHNDARQQFRRALVVLSDGEDTQSYATREQALEAAQKSNVVIYSISTNDGRLESHGDKVLHYLAQATGGLAYFPFKAGDLSRSFQQLAAELRHQYNIYYRPEPLPSDGRYHSITVRVKGRKDLAVRTRKGYWAPRPQ